MNADQYGVRVCAAILRPGDEILVVRESRRGALFVNLPGGTPELDETLERAIVREVSEETGYDVVPTEIAFVAERRAERFGASTLEICFYATVAAALQRPQRAGENILSIEWLSIHDRALLRDIPHAALLGSNKRGRYIDESSPSSLRRSQAI
ncbi:MAG: NUDIX hydrolase [Candidatus Cybelea sp.]